MILFLDTSALVKLYIVEDGSEIAHEAAQQADILAVSRIAWAEYHAALARRARTSPEDEDLLDQARETLASEWCNYFVVEVSQPVVELAGEHAELYALRAYDAVQLATASYLAGQSRKTVQFGCFDRRLNKAATAQAMQTL
ncbi:MAG: type II toxin-antitoxin system VapC family toxin [Wenzhouxiangella sp.]|nr:type II toxin-antitoxin system VapC family toxin [Wenzhouxiangella sp.]MCH8479741.1 type II toxin-antitoxin system VapC family toxin [Wenzhouxiangella sp.]